MFRLSTQRGRLAALAAVVAVPAALWISAASQALGSGCPEEKPKNQACIAPDECQTRSMAGCLARTAKYPKNGPFGCEANAGVKTECLTGVYPADAADCYDEYSCKVTNQACVPNQFLGTPREIKKILDPC